MANQPQKKKRHDKGERLAGDTTFSKFNYTDNSNSVTKVKYQYKVSGGAWSPLTPPELPVPQVGPNAHKASADPNVANVTQVQMAVFKNNAYGPWVQGNAIANGVASATGSTASDGTNSLSDSSSL